MSRVSEEVLRRVKSSITAYAGLELPDWVVTSRLEQRVAALALADAGAYADLITSDAGMRERELLIEVLRVGETRFFRHASHVRALTDVVIPALRAEKPAGPIRAWSAGCASGEEAYTMAMVLRKLLPRTCEVSVLATDISAEALEVARAALYPEVALSHAPERWRSWGFVPAPADDHGNLRVAVAPAITELVEFERRNLADGGFRRGFDLVWCRNVLIYFAPEARAQTLDRLVGSLTDGGFLFLGYAETLRDGGRVEAVRAPDAVLYRKCAPRAPEPAPPLTEPAPVFRRHTPAPMPAIEPEEALIELRGRYPDGARLSRELAGLMSRPYRAAVIDLDGAEFLGDEAAAVLRRARAAARAAGMHITLVARRPGTQRFLRRAGLADGGEE